MDIRIVCTHDAAKFAEALMRPLGGEQHQASLIVGRQSLLEVEAAKASNAVVVLIWSANAPSQHYMREWARNIPPARLIEIGRAPGWPQSERKAPVIDFTTWRGERGGRAWHSLKERLRLIARGFEPQAKSTPQRAAMALGLAGIAAVGAVAIVRMHELAPSVPIAAPEPPERTITTLEAAVDGDIDSDAGVGGPLSMAPEPPSAEELDLVSLPEFAPVDTMPANRIEIPEYRAPEVRDPTLLERLSALNPLRDISFSDEEEDEG